jgi:hypothetical protein
VTSAAPAGYRRAIKRAIGTLLPLVLVLAGCGGVRLVPSRSASADAAAHYAERVADTAHVFAGVRVNYPKPNAVFVQLTHPPASVIARLRAAYPGVYVIQTGLPRTLSEVRARQRSVNVAKWEARDVDVLETFAQNGYLRVGVRSNVARAQALFDEKYGRGVVRVFHGESVGCACAWGATGQTR